MKIFREAYALLQYPQFYFLKDMTNCIFFKQNVVYLGKENDYVTI